MTPRLEFLLTQDTDLRELVEAIQKKYGPDDEFLERALWCVAQLGATIGEIDSLKRVRRAIVGKQ